MPDPLLYRTGQTVQTNLSLHCMAKTTATFDLNDTTWVTFYAGTIPVWETLLSVASIRVTLLQSIVSGPLTLEEGLTTNFNPLGDQYTVTLSGTIVDNGKRTSISGKALGVFVRGSEEKRSMRALQELIRATL